jgi:hypothetical protein
MKVRLKDPSTVIRRPGRDDVHSGNLTDEVYAEVVKDVPQLKALFEEAPEPPKKKPASGTE